MAPLFPSACGGGRGAGLAGGVIAVARVPRGQGWRGVARPLVAAVGWKGVAQAGRG